MLFSTKHFTKWSREEGLTPEERREKAARSFIDMVKFYRQLADPEGREKLIDAYAKKHKDDKPPKEYGFRPFLGAGDASKMMCHNKVAGYDHDDPDRDRVIAEDLLVDALDAIKTPKARRAIELVHLEGKTAVQAARRLGVTDRQVRRLKAKGYQEMKLPAVWEEKLGNIIEDDDIYGGDLDELYLGLEDIMQ